MAKKTLLILFTALSLSAVITGCNSRKNSQDSLAEKLSETTVEKTDDDSPEKKEEPAVEEETETAADEEDDTEISEDMYKADASEVFSAMADWAYTFSSGAGGWSTLEDADFDDDYEIVIPDRNYREYKLADGSNTPFYMQYPEDGAQRLYYAYDLDEYMNRSDDSEENTCMMYLYLNEDDEVVYGFEEYTP